MTALRRSSIVTVVLIVFFLITLIQGIRAGDPLLFFTEVFPSPSIILTSAPSVLPQSSEIVRVVKVIDGDTIQLEDGRKLRYIGIDTPETVDPRRGVQCFGKEASEKNKELVLNKEVRLEKDVSETDRYGRLLRYVYIGDTMINEQLVKEGFAKASSYPPDITYQILFQEAEKQAREEKNGLWSSCSIKP